MFRRPSSVISHQSSASVTTIHTYQSFQSCGHRFLCRPTDSFKYVQSGKVVDRGIICGEFPIHSSLPWFMVRIRNPLYVKIAPGPILPDDGWRTTDDGLGVNGVSYFLSERFWLKRTTDGLTDMCEWGMTYNSRLHVGPIWCNIIILLFYTLVTRYHWLHVTLIVLHGDQVNRVYL